MSTVTTASSSSTLRCPSGPKRTETVSSSAYFGTELRRHRERMGWKRDQLADRVPWSVWTVTSVEQGRRKPPPGLGEHADALFGLPAS